MSKAIGRSVWPNQTTAGTAVGHTGRMPVPRCAGVWRRVAWVAIAAAWAAPAVAAAPATQPAAARAYQAMVEKLAAPGMEGRGPGTKGADKARDWLVEQFRSIGLRGAFEGAFTQEFRVPAGAAVEQQELTAAPAKGGEKAGSFRAGVDFSAMGFSASKAFAGEAVFVGYSVVEAGRKYDSYAGADAADALKGKVAVVLRYEPQDARGVSLWTQKSGSWSRSAGLIYKVAQAARRGAVAVLIVNPPAQATGKVDPAQRTAFGRAARVPVLHVTRGAYKRILRAAGREADDAARKLREAANGGTGGCVPLGVVLRGRVTVRKTLSPVHNVAGVLGGAGTLAGQFVVVGAHYDHVGYGYFGSRSRSREPKVHPGADDNASGTAGVVTLARRFAARAKAAATAKDPPARRSLLFVTFAGEELGLLGSRHLLANLSELGIRREQIVAMVNMDMIGRLRQGRLAVWGVDSGDRWRRMVATAAEGSKLKLLLSGSGFGASDHASFYGAKIPVLGFNTGMHADLHSPTDTADKINPAGAIEVLALVEKVAARLWTDEPRVAYVAPKAGSRGAMLGVRLGAAHEGGGCRIASVVPGGPAATAGLRDGDVVVRWNGSEVADAEALVVLVRHSRAGQSVRLGVRRDGKTLDVKVKLAGR